MILLWPFYKTYCSSKSLIFWMFNYTFRSRERRRRLSWRESDSHTIVSIETTITYFSLYKWYNRRLGHLISTVLGIRRAGVAVLPWAWNLLQMILDEELCLVPLAVNLCQAMWERRSLSSLLFEKLWLEAIGVELSNAWCFPWYCLISFKNNVEPVNTL